MWKFLILVVGVLFPWWSDAQESKEPWFITCLLYTSDAADE